MDDVLHVDEHGFIDNVSLQGENVPFRKGKEGGPSWQVQYNGKLYCEEGQSILRDGYYCLQYKGVQLKKKISVLNGTLQIELRVLNESSQVFRPDKLSIALGIDSYMVSYPQWKDRLFPTLLRCEKSHFYGYFSSPNGGILGIACAQPIASWSLRYNQLFCYGGHRVEGTALELMNAGPLPKHHPKQEYLQPGESRKWMIQLRPSQTIQQALNWVSEIIDGPVFCGERLIYERGEEAELAFYAPSFVSVFDGKTVYPTQMSDGQWIARLPSMEAGEAHSFTAKCGDRACEVNVYWRKEWSWYIRQAARESVLKPQRATSNVESWYGFYSGLAAMRYFPDQERDAEILKSIRQTLPLLYDMECGVPTHTAHRIQNTACTIGMCVDAWQATGDRQWLSLAQKMAAFLLERCQTEDGAFRNGKLHYTCVVYIAKSILELWQAERALSQYQELAKKHFASAKRAVDELISRLDNIGTEGEATFEDGMISCEILQIAFLALQLPKTEHGHYISAAEKLLFKHRCLERISSPDCRSRNTTIRFWEAQYDVLTPDNFISSPHGWSAWKAYAVWYLYLLTGKTEYLTDSMETLGSCAQLIDASGELRWAFCVDPQVQTGLWQEDPAGSGMGKVIPSVLGECYIPMISGWYRPPENTPVFGFLGKNREYSTDQGGCGDNDVHECFKAIAETALLYGYVYEDELGIHAYNGRIEETESGELFFTPMESVIAAVHINLWRKQRVSILYDTGCISEVLDCGWIARNGKSAETIPCI